MSTSATIAQLHPNGAITSIYCHRGGGIGGVGTLLVQHYPTPCHARQLLHLGNISCLGTDIYDTVAMYRDHGESLYQRKYPNYNEYEQDCIRELDIEYKYLFRDHKWWVMCTDVCPTFIPVSSLLEVYK